MLWASTLVTTLGAVALLVVGVVVVRPRSPRSGQLLALGGVLGLVTTCCHRATTLAPDHLHAGGTGVLLSAADRTQDVLTLGAAALVVAAVALLGRDAPRTRGPSA